MIRKAYLQLYGIPTAVLLIGMISIGLLIWVDRINERQRADFALLDSLEHVQTYTTTFHLWLEESIAGDDRLSNGNYWNNLDTADHLVDIMMHGGESLTGVMIAPSANPDFLSQMEAVKNLLAQLRTQARDRLKDRANAGIGTEQDLRFDDLFRDIILRAAGMEKIVEREKQANQIRARRLIIGIFLTWTVIILGATAGLYSREGKRRTAEWKLRAAHETLLSQAKELEGHREHLAELVDNRTDEIVKVNERLRSEIRERRQTAEALKDSRDQLRILSSRLLSTQEDERRKISRELHDELGQSLTLIKIQLRSIEKHLRGDQGMLREECSSILQYLNTVIENVRRLSRDLSPIVLEDLGLTRALRWLAERASRNDSLRINLDLANLEGLFSSEAQTSIYRIVQEAVTNIMKHSEAHSATISAQCRENGMVSFAIEDDGRGFDTRAAAAVDAEQRGLGLVSIEERITMLGGSLELSSEPGKGTRILFNIPAREGMACNELVPHIIG